MSEPVVTIAIPSLNQSKFLDRAIESVFSQGVEVEVFLMDGGSSDGTLEVIYKWSDMLAGWRSYSDDGQSAAINEGIFKGRAPFVAWLNSDDYFLPGALRSLVSCLQEQSSFPMVYANSLSENQISGSQKKTWVEKFSEDRLAKRCIISQPATLIRRSVWEDVQGLNVNLFMAMDYDLWWRIYRAFGAPFFLDEIVSVNATHPETKTNKYRELHFSESMSVVKLHNGFIPTRWWLAYPYSVLLKALINSCSLK